jgi:multidrug efflux pump subunit AcrB
MDVDLSNPEITLTVDRDRALINGVSTAQVGQEIRTALFGREVSKITEGEDEYKIQLRNNELQRNNLIDLLNMNVTFRDMGTAEQLKMYQSVLW